MYRGVGPTLVGIIPYAGEWTNFNLFFQHQSETS